MLSYGRVLNGPGRWERARADRPLAWRLTEWKGIWDPWMERYKFHAVSAYLGIIRGMIHYDDFAYNKKRITSDFKSSQLSAEDVTLYSLLGFLASNLMELWSRLGELKATTAAMMMTGRIFVGESPRMAGPMLFQIHSRLNLKHQNGTPSHPTRGESPNERQGFTVFRCQVSTGSTLQADS